MPIYNNSGTVLLAYISIVDEVKVTIWQEWLGPKFRLNDTDSWPVSPDALQNMINRMHKITIKQNVFEYDTD